MTIKGFYDEMFDENNNVRPNYKHFLERLEKLDQKKIFNTLQTELSYH
jgi:uncharacterized circularly permuted ATP-grasp superfamily protein